MKFKTITSRLIFLSVFAIAMGLAGYGFVSFKRNLTALDLANQENINWHAMRLETDLLRFNNMLKLYEVDANITANVINQRFDILWSKVAVFEQGKVGRRLTSYSGENGAIALLFQDMKDHASSIERIDELSSDEVLQLQAMFYQYEAELRGVTKTVFLGEQDNLAGIHAQLRDSANVTLILSLASVVLLLLGLAFSVWQASQFKKLASKNIKLAIAAEDASQAKTRFLTMMSHELRTPMNGVLGLLALLRQSASESQEHIVDQADRSAHQMISMLTDILDFSALQNDEIKFENKAFELVQLSDALDDFFGPEAVRAGIDFSATSIASEPMRLSGDFRRIKQISAHLVGYFVDLAGLKAVALKFDFDGGNLITDIELNYGSEGPTWTPDLIFGKRNSNEDSFMADALGPAVARGLIAKMGGEMTQKPTNNGALKVRVSIPAERVQLSKVKIKLDLTSAVMDSICRSSLRDAPIEFVSDELDRDVNIVLYETGGMDEAARIAQQKQQLPKALIVALGRPINAELFDFTIASPAQLSKQLGTLVHDLAS